MQTTVNPVVEEVARRNANYKPNIWNYERLQALRNEYEGAMYRREAEMLKAEVLSVFRAVEDPLHKLELIDQMNKLSLSHLFKEEIREAILKIVSIEGIASAMNESLYSCSLYFRILRQYGFDVSPDMFLNFIDGEESLAANTNSDAKPMLELYEASHFAKEGEGLLDRAKAVAYKNLKHFLSNNRGSNIYAPNCPLNQSVGWYNAKVHINGHDMIINRRSSMPRLARLSFNMVQAQHQKDLKEILGWWRNLGVCESLSFTRDRVVESFLWAVGVAYEPEYGSLRKWLTKAILLVLIIDDMYDIYASLEESEIFTKAVERWDPTEIEQLPEPIQKCFWILHDTARNIDLEVQSEKGWKSVLPYIRNYWTDFCKALLLEARWHHTGYFPTLKEYLDNGWVSSCGPVLALHALIGIGQERNETLDILDTKQEIVHYSSMIIRLCNDLGTSKAELERGDAPSSVLCYMREASATEDEARQYIRDLITSCWNKLNEFFINSSHVQQPIIRYIINTGRVASFIYQDGDGFGVQDKGTREQVLSCLIEPLPIL
uniref:Terpene synthase n=1 Tax=Scoparia dulcis TaxID=107240 RepID=A0A1W7HBY1_SCODU